MYARLRKDPAYHPIKSAPSHTLRNFFSRFLLIALVGVLIFALVKYMGGFGDSDGPVSFGTSLDPNELHTNAFQVDSRVRLAVHAVGSFEGDDLAAYGWIVDRATGDVVWQMLPENATPGRGTLATVDDTLSFEPGIYDAWFTSYGDPLQEAIDSGNGIIDRLGSLISRDGRIWHGDAERWRFSLSYAEPEASEVVHGLHGSDTRPDKNITLPEGLIWTSGAARNNAEHMYVFEVSAPIDVRLQATGELVDGELLDGAQISRIFDNEAIWDMANSPMIWAGGSIKNQRVDTTVTLSRGFYKASFTTDRSHAYDDWTGNPPLNPVSWGFTMSAADSTVGNRIAEFDPWSGRLPRIASFSCVGEDELLEDTFTLPDTTAVMISSVGEVIGSSSYDYGVLLRQPPNTVGTEEVWSMERVETRHAGGTDKNRLAEAILTLTPGTYTLSYRTDGSHNCGDFNSDPPDNPDRWGITLFAFDPDFDLGAVTRQDSPPDDIEHIGTDSLGAPSGEVLVRFKRVGNDEHRRATFLLQDSGRIRIYALGEILPSGAYDYAWIEDSGGERIWEMTRENTTRAGGTAKNRLFNGSVPLSAGRYTVHYVTDGSHAYGDFGQPPNDPASWGIVIYRE